jgi:hypothetical protein
VAYRVPILLGDGSTDYYWVFKMAKEALSKEEFDDFKDNHFAHLCLDVTGIKKDVSWLKWLICGSFMAILIRIILLFFGI